jgi:hypothetical protein
MLLGIRAQEAWDAKQVGFDWKHVDEAALWTHLFRSLEESRY